MVKGSWQLRIITNLITMKSNLSDKEDHIDIEMVINLHRRKHKPQTVAITCLKCLDSVRFSE